MASDKKFTPKEAALMVLAKAQDLYKSSTLAKGDWAKIHSKLKREGYSEESADKIDGAIKAKMGKSEETSNPDEKADAALGEKVEQEVEQHEEQNEAPEHKMKGHIKLAKFMGRMEHKRSQSLDKGETGHEKGINTSASATGGQSKMGNHIVAARDAKHDYGGGKVHTLDAKNVAKDKLGEMKQMPKPKLPG